MKRLGCLITFLILALAIPIELTGQRANLSQFSGIAQTVDSILKPTAFITGKVEIDSAFIYDNDIILYFNRSLAEYPIREESLREIYSRVANMLPSSYSKKRLRIVSNGSILDELVIPTELNNYGVIKESLPHITRLSKPYTITKGLNSKHIALWHSHGYYYSQNLMRWEWQRPRLFQTVEDLFTQSFLLPFLVPMLENAGANLYIPRERDFQTYEFIGDNDNPASGYRESFGKYRWEKSPKPGFANPKEFYLSGENPFEMGSAKMVKSTKSRDESTISWSATFDTPGNYAVYISYHSFNNSTTNAQYRVYHAGGESHFVVNQKIGGGTWIYLGTFYFDNNEEADYRVVLSNITGKEGEIVSGDAVKFGGGMGNIARSTPDAQPEISRYPRFNEGARYWLQWAGFNDTIYSPTNDRNDYVDDYSSRGLWVNQLTGGSSQNPNQKGLAIPLDMAFAFHSDAGITMNDSIIGTLAIYTRFSEGSDLFPNRLSRFISRYLTDLVQTQIVEDIKALHEPIWQRRGVWDRSYHESRVPVVPTMLLELLSHQNFADMRYGLDPTFKFDVSRAIYKGILRFLSLRDGTPYIVQPLPVVNFAADISGNKAILKWEAQRDALESTAESNKYIVYTRIDGAGFDNGRVILSPSFEMEIEPDKIYSFKIAALNDGGESFPSEILSLYQHPQPKGNVLIINGFDRLSAPFSFSTADTTYAGFVNMQDSGVPYLYEASFTGEQSEFRRNSPWISNDSPGFGASFANYEAQVSAGNSFDYPYLHGSIFAKNGFSFVSCSRDGLYNLTNDYSRFDIVDLILGKQGETKIGRGVKGVKYGIYTPKLVDMLSQYLKEGGNLLISGANVASDLWDNYNIDSSFINFAQKKLKYEWITSRASKTAEVESAPNSFGFNTKISFYNQPNRDSYSVESPDGIAPYNNESQTIMRYKENNISAAIAHKGEYKTVILGFPIESIIESKEREKIMSEIIHFFIKSSNE